MAKSEREREWPARKRGGWDGSRAGSGFSQLPTVLGAIKAGAVLAVLGPQALPWERDVLGRGGPARGCARCSLRSQP